MGIQEPQQESTQLSKKLIVDVVIGVVVLGFSVNQLANEVQVPLPVNIAVIVTGLLIILFVTINKIRLAIAIGILGLVTSVILLVVFQSPHNKIIAKSKPTVTPFPPTITVGIGTPSPTPYPPTSGPGEPTVTPTPTPTPRPTPTHTLTSDPCPYNPDAYYQVVSGYDASKFIAGDSFEIASVENKLKGNLNPCQNYGHRAALVKVYSYATNDSDATAQANRIIAIMRDLGSKGFIFVGSVQYSSVNGSGNDYMALGITWST